MPVFWTRLSRGLFAVGAAGLFLGSQQADANCSPRMGQATINEVHRQGNAARFIELRMLTSGIPASEYSGWTLSYCSSSISPCRTVSLNAASFNHQHPWLVLTMAGIPNQNYIDLADGMEVRLNDASGAAIDYLSVAGYSSQLAVSCPFPYDTTMPGSNSATIMRLPEGTGDWALSGPGNSGSPTPGDSNDGSEPELGYDHLRLLHPASGLTCSPSTVTIQACADPACTDLHPDPVHVSLTSPAGWQPNPLTIEQSGTVALQVTTPGAVLLNAASDPAAENPTRCFIAGVESNCQMHWHDSGFVLDVPHHVAATSQPGTITAVRTDDVSQRCVPGFADVTRSVEFHFNYLNPVTGSAAPAVNGDPIALGSPGAPIELDFDGNGSAPLTVSYPDAGAIGLHAYFQGSGPEAGLEMTGSREIIVRPDHFALTVPGNPEATGVGDPVFRRAGEPFSVVVTARNAVGAVTPNFGREASPASVELDTELVAPAGGYVPDVDGGFGSFGLDCDGQPASGGSACGAFTWPEVGILQLVPRLAGGSYLGSGNVTGPASASIGRFIPHHFTISETNLINRAAFSDCSDPFTYQGERFDIEFILTARHGGGGTTGNYHGAFARLDGTGLGLAGSETLDVIAAEANWIGGSADVHASLRLPRSTLAPPLEAFPVGTAPVDADDTSLASFDLDLSGNDTDDHALVGTTDLLFGRLQVDSAVGSELGPIALPWRAEYWDGVTWRVANDSCTEIVLSEHISLTGANGVPVNGAELVFIGSGSTQIDGSTLGPDNGIGQFLFTAPGDIGWVDLAFELDDDYPYLLDDLADEGDFTDNPEARATFGLFAGDRRRIFLREVAPN